MESTEYMEQLPERSPMSLPLETLTGESSTPARAMLSEFISFAVIGGTAAFLFVGLSALMVELRTGAPDWLVSSACYALFIVPVYLAHRRFSFRSDAPHRQALPRYVLVQILGFCLATLFSFVCYGVLQLPTLTAAIVVVALTSGINFAIVRMWAFSEGR